MPTFYVQFTRFAARSISVSGNATDAIEAVRKEFEAPIYCRIHNGMPPDQCSAQVGQMGYYHPRKLPIEPESVQAMREIYRAGGYCLIPM